MGEPRNYSGVVVNRSNIQILLLDLYDFAKHPESRKKLAENRFDRSVFGTLPRKKDRQNRWNRRTRISFWIDGRV